MTFLFPPLSHSDNAAKRLHAKLTGRGPVVVQAAGNQRRGHEILPTGAGCAAQLCAGG